MIGRRTPAAAALLAAALAAPAQAACSARFDAFLRAFREDAAFRDAHTRFPVRWTHLDATAEPEPRTRHALVHRSDAEGRRRLVLPEPGRDVEVRILRSGRGDRRVRSVRPDSDALVLGHAFARTRACWQLTAVRDDSL